ncbi:MAG: hypothetical protein ACREXW_12110 [Gammaproteobacteria bacterium]
MSGYGGPLLQSQPGASCRSGIAATLVYVLYERCFGWSMDLHVDPVIVAQGIVLAVGAALLAGIYPARRAARSSPAAVLRND